MSVQEVTMFRVVCDWPDCGRTAQDGEYSAWGEPTPAIDEANNSDWWIGADGKTHYCGEHPTEWASDHENGEPYPTSAYLLIHDGDTDDSDDDGRVTYKAGGSS